MKEQLQDEKIKYKLEIIKELIKRLSEYNNIEGYNNQKKFVININYNKDPNSDKLYYNIRISRGLNNPSTIFSMRFVSNGNINDLLIELINSLIESKEFLYTSYTALHSKKEKYNIILKNDVVVEFGIKDNDMLRLTENIENKFKEKEITVEKKELPTKEKDEIQQEKIIGILKKIFKILEEYNSLENYENKKRYNFKISNYYSKDRQCYIYNFSIIRGKNIEETVLSLNATIIDNDIVYKLINSLINEYLNKETFLYDFIKESSYDDNYSIYLKNDMKIEFSYGNERDRFFYKEIYKRNKTNNKQLIKTI